MLRGVARLFSIDDRPTLTTVTSSIAMTKPMASVTSGSMPVRAWTTALRGGVAMAPAGAGHCVDMISFCRIAARQFRREANGNTSKDVILGFLRNAINKHNL